MSNPLKDALVTALAEMTIETTEQIVTETRQTAAAFVDRRVQILEDTAKSFRRQAEGCFHLGQDGPAASYRLSAAAREYAARELREVHTALVSDRALV